MRNMDGKNITLFRYEINLKINNRYGCL